MQYLMKRINEIHFFNISILCFKNPLWHFAIAHTSVWSAVKHQHAPLPQTFLKKITRVDIEE